MRSRSIGTAAAGLILALAALLAGAAAACGPDTPCRIEDRHYFVRMPAGHDGRAKVGAIIYAHGYRDTARAVMRNRWFERLGNSMGVAFIAPKSSGDDWSLPGSPSRMRGAPAIDELAFFDRLLADVTGRFAIDAQRIMVTGFSAGGMMVWTLACHRSDRFAAFIPIAGTFWRPVPEQCSSPPTSIMHLHGDSDPTVPLQGRPIGRAHQGEVMQVIDMYARYGGFGAANALRRGDLRCQQRRNPAGHILELCLFSGGHAFNSDYIRRAWDALVSARQAG